jgi:4-hydroxy-tetrahydrodipicolinate synthase
MDRNTVDWHGQFTALITPFDAEGNIDEPALRRQVEFVISRGVRGIVVNGCTGEFWAQSMDERKRVVKIVVEQARGRIAVLGSSTAPGTREVIELTRYHKDIGCDGVMIMPPFMVRLNKDDLFHHYKAVSDAVEIPIMLYNLPSDIVNDLTPDMVNRLADLKCVVAIKDSSFDFNIFWRLQCLVSDRIRVMIGPSTMFGAAAVQHGCEGWVDTYSNLWPELTVELFRTAKAGEMKRALVLQKTASDFRRFLSQADWNMYCAVKAAMNCVGLPGGYPRLPLRALGEPHIGVIRQGMKQFGVPGAGTRLATAAE